MSTPSPENRTLARIVQGMVAIVLLAVVFLLFLPVSTPPFRDETGYRPAAGSIAVAERWRINGADQAVVIRGRHLTDPVLIWVGDLACETPALRHFNDHLEQRFVVVYWCQRQSGQSFNPFAAPPKSLTIDQYVSDLGVLVDDVRARLHKDKVVLVGHSSGTIFGLLYAHRHPEHVAAYVGVGQVVNPAKSLARGYEWALGQAKARGDAKGLTELTRIGPPPYRGDEGPLLRKRLIAYGGAFHARLSYGKLARISARAREANWRDATAAVFGEAYTAAMDRELRAVAFDEAGPKDFTVPVFLVSGRYDRRADGALAQAYLDQITAPKKGFAWFEGSAHSPPFEEPDAFDAWIFRDILPLTAADGRAGHG